MATEQVELINGLHLDFPSAELKERLEKRLEHHKARVAAYKKQREDLAKLEAALGEEQKKMSKVSNRQSPLDSVDEAIKRHENHCVFYQIAATHLKPNAVYRLDENALTRLGFTSHSW